MVPPVPGETDPGGHPPRAPACKPIPVYGDGLNVRDWLYVTDHAEALWQVLTRGRDGETYNVGGHNEWANLRIVELICDPSTNSLPELGGNSRRLITFVKDRPGMTAVTPSTLPRSNSELGWTRARLRTGPPPDDPMVPRPPGLGARRASAVTRESTVVETDGVCSRDSKRPWIGRGADHSTWLRRRVGSRSAAALLRGPRH